MIMKGISIDPDPVHGTGSGPHSGADASALQRGSRCSGAAQKERRAADRQFPVCPYIKENRNIRPPVHLCRDHAADDIAAEIVGPSRDAVDLPRDRETERGAGNEAGIQHRHGVGLVKHAEGIHSQKEVDHRRVAGDHHRDAVLRPDSGLLRRPVHQLPDRRAGFLLYLLQPLRLILAAENPAQNVLAEPDLAVVSAFLVEQLPRPAVHQIEHNRRAAEIHRAAVMRRGRPARLDSDHVPCQSVEGKRRRDAPFSADQRTVEALQSLILKTNRRLLPAVSHFFRLRVPAVPRLPDRLQKSRFLVAGVLRRRRRQRKFHLPADSLHIVPP